VEIPEACSGCEKNKNNKGEDPFFHYAGLRVVVFRMEKQPIFSISL
jgi:hypothetical protein